MIGQGRHPFHPQPQVKARTRGDQPTCDREQTRATARSGLQASARSVSVRKMPSKLIIPVVYIYLINLMNA